MNSQIVFVLCIAFFLEATESFAQTADNKTLGPVRKSLDNPTPTDWDKIDSPQLVTILEVMNLPGDKNLVDDNSLLKLQRFKQLRTLMIGSQLVTNKSMKQIVELKSLEALIVYDCEITDDGLLELRRLPKLRTVGIFATRVTPNGVDRLKEKLPNIKIQVWGWEDGDVFDANGCLTTKFRIEHCGLVFDRNSGKK